MDVFILGALRTPLGLRRGQLSGWHAVELLAAIFDAFAGKASGHPLGKESGNAASGTSNAVASKGWLVEGVTLIPETIDDVIVGCASPIGEQSMNVARNALIAAGWPESIPAQVIEAQGASSHLAFQLAVNEIASGMADVVICAGTESMTRVPLGATFGPGIGSPYGKAVHNRYASDGGLIPPGMVAERLAQRYSLSRADVDGYARESRARYEDMKMTDFEWCALELADQASLASARATRGRRINQDETRVSLTEPDDVPSAFDPNGIITASTFAMPGDGAGALLLCSAEYVKTLGISAPISVCSTAKRGTHPLHGDSGFDTAQCALKNADKQLDEISSIVIHEDSAVTPVAFARDANIQTDLLNRAGGCLATSEPLGATCVIDLVQLVHQINSDGGSGLYVSGGSGGVSCASVLEKLYTPCG